jgi:hypothetical protein
VSKGSSPAGSTTQTSVNPTQQVQLPFLQTGSNNAQNLYNNNPMSYYPGQTLADFRAPNAFVGDAYNQMYNVGQGLNAFLPGYNAAYSSAIGGGMGGAASPAYPYYQQAAAGQSGPQQYYRSVGDLSTNAGNLYAGNIAGYAGQAGANNNVGLNALGTTAAGGGPGMEQLAQTASGYYLNSNPYIDKMYQTAAAPVTQNFQTAIAPGLDYGFANSGRYGSGAQAAAQGNAQQNLGRTLGDLSTNIYGQNYARERQAQDTAASQYTQLGTQAGANYGQLYNQGLGLGITGNQAAGQVYDQGLRTALSAAQADAAAQQYGVSGLQSGFNTGNAAQMAALGLFPQVAAAQMAPANATLQAGQGLSSIDQTYRAFEQAQMDDAAKRFYGVQSAPYTTLDAFMKNIGSPTAGSGTVSNPYFSNPVANALGAATGATGIAKNLGKLGGGGGAAGTAADIGADFGGIGIAPLTGASSVGTAAASGGIPLLGKLGSMFGL